MTRIWFRSALAILFGALLLGLMDNSADAGWRHRRHGCGGRGCWGGGGCSGGWGGGCSGGGCYGGGCSGGGAYYGGAKYGGAYYRGSNGYYGGSYAAPGAPAAPYPNRGVEGPAARSARGTIDAEGSTRTDGSLRSQSDRNGNENPPPPPPGAESPAELPEPGTPPAETDSPASES